MERETKSVSRLELYKQVWETPVTQLAKTYGISDVGLAKICKKYKIPRPPRGYWAKKAAGQQMAKTPLPNRASNDTIDITPNTANQFDSVPDPKFSQAIAESANHPPIVAAKMLRNPHPIVAQSADILELCKPNSDGLLVTKRKRCLDIRVSERSLRRALRIMDAIIKGLETRGYDVRLKEQLAEVQIHGESLRFGLSEDLETQKREQDDDNLEGYYHFRHSRFEHVRVPTGNLCLTIHSSGYYGRQSPRKNWRDTKRKTLEESLDAFVLGLVKFAAKKKEYRLKREEEERQRQERERQWQEEQRRLAELKRQAKEEKQRVDKLLEDAENHEKSRQLRAFIAAVENERLKGNPAYVSDDEYEAWVAWARDQADRLDPLADSPASILDEIDPDEDDRAAARNRFNPYFRTW